MRTSCEPNVDLSDLSALRPRFYPNPVAAGKQALQCERISRAHVIYLDALEEEVGAPSLRDDAILEITVRLALRGQVGVNRPIAYRIKRDAGNIRVGHGDGHVGGIRRHTRGKNRPRDVRSRRHPQNAEMAGIVHLPDIAASQGNSKSAFRRQQDQPALSHPPRATPYLAPCR